MITSIIKPDIFPVKYGLIVGEWDQAEADKMATDFGLPSERMITPPETAGCCYPVPAGAIIYLSEYPSKTSMLGILAHEVNHAVFITGRQLGFGYSEEADEWYCYMAQFLVQDIMEDLLEANEKTAKKTAKKAAKKAAKKTK